jgi:DMSO/TMAO reductase YedYZ heme-binding membrane subunit
VRIDLKELLKSKHINGWRLFFLISIPISIDIFMQMLNSDMSSGEEAANMISYSVRYAIPFIFIVAAASSVQVLFPSPFSKWWLRNRKYLGMCFANAMAWQGMFIFILSTFQRDYYFEEVYFLRDELEGTVGYIFLFGMIVTSFNYGRKHVTPMQWKLVQKGGLYFLWSYAFSVYWWNLYYYPTHEPFSVPRVLDYIFYWAGFLSMVLRIAAWGKQRAQRSKKKSPMANPPLLFKAIGSSLIVTGLLASFTADYWYTAVNGFLTGPSWSAELVLWLPFWPLEPFLSLLIIGIGTWLYTKVLPQVEVVKTA